MQVRRSVRALQALGGSALELCVIAAVILTLVSLVPAAATTVAATPVWAPASENAKHVLLRPKSWTVPKGSDPERMTVVVSAAPDVKNGGKVLAIYKLYVNGVFVGVGPGRGEGPVSKASLSLVYDTIHVPRDVLAVRKGNQISIALQVSEVGSPRYRVAIRAIVGVVCSRVLCLSSHLTSPPSPSLPPSNPFTFPQSATTPTETRTPGLS